MFNRGDIVTYKNRMFRFCGYYDDSNVLIYSLHGIEYDTILVGIKSITEYSIIEREDKFKNLLDV